MQTIYKLDTAGVYVGRTMEIADADPCPLGWTRVDCSVIPEGQYGQVIAGKLTLHDDYPGVAVVVPVMVTQRQGRIILARYGLLSAVEAYFSSEGLEEQKIDFEYAQEWRRDWQALIDAAYSLGLSDEQIDAMFVEAAQI